MRIGLASDSHGNVDLLERALVLFRRAQVERVFFLGNRVEDLYAVLARRGGSRGAAAARVEHLSPVQGALERHATLGADPLAGRVVLVASRGCPEYESGKVPRKQMDLADGLICCLVHDKGELSRDDIENASILFHGNSGAAALVQFGPRCFITPGHLRAGAPDGGPPSFAIADVTARQIVLTVFSGDGSELRQDRALVGFAGKLSVR